MEISLHSSRISEKEKALSLLKESFHFRVFHRLPQLSNFVFEPRWISKTAEVPLETTLEWIDILIGSGLWVKTGSGKIVISSEEINYVAKVPDYLAVNASILARLTENGPCWYENDTIATNEELYRDFTKKVYNEFVDFKKKSTNVAADKIVTYSFNILRAADLNFSKERE